MFRFSMLAAGAAAIALTTAVPAPAEAASTQISPAFAAPQVESSVIEVQRYRGHHRWHRHGRWRDRDAWIALGLGSAIIGGMMAAQNSPSYGYAQSAWDRCADRFRSLRADGTYTTYDGRQVLCPYLR